MIGWPSFSTSCCLTQILLFTFWWERGNYGDQTPHQAQRTEQRWRLMGGNCGYGTIFKLPDRWSQYLIYTKTRLASPCVKNCTEVTHGLVHNKYDAAIDWIGCMWDVHVWQYVVPGEQGQEMFIQATGLKSILSDTHDMIIRIDNARPCLMGGIIWAIGCDNCNGHERIIP